MHHQSQWAATCRLTGSPGALAWLVHLEPSIDPLWLYVFSLLSASALLLLFLASSGVLCLVQPKRSR